VHNTATAIGQIFDDGTQRVENDGKRTARCDARGESSGGRPICTTTRIQTIGTFPRRGRGQAGVLVRDPRNGSPVPAYFVLLEWDGDRLLSIRDFRYARYAIEGADFTTLV
jgi:hypothetical protein